MADEKPVTQATASVPPMINPITHKPVAAGATVTGLKPGLRLPPKPGATVSIKPGLKLPPKPGATANLKPGLKLPPKPGATVTGLKPGLKLPPKPGATVALKPGLKLPTHPVARPVIHKPGETIASKPLPKPVMPTAAAPAVERPAAPAAAAPAPAPVPTPAPAPASAPAPAPAPAAAAPVSKPIAPKPLDAAPKPTVTKPAVPKPVVPVDMQGVGKLPTVSSVAVDRNAPAAEKPAATPPDAMSALKSVTQKLKGITQQIPPQAVLHKTGIIADAAMSEGQKQAAKSKTARISLSEAIGVAPTKTSAPMKTIKIRRPTEIPGAMSTKLQTAAAKTVAAPVAEAETKPAEDNKTSQTTKAADPTLTQRKTLKIARPAGGVVRPQGKFGIKRPTQQPTVEKTAAEPAKDPAAPAEAPAVADIADIPSIPDMPIPATLPISNGPAWLWTLSSLVQVAACATMAALAWLLYQNFITQYF